jgi:uncharacterized protein involved in copper resistance
MTRRTGTRRIVIFTVILAVASAVCGVILMATRPRSSVMAGMDMSVTSPAPSPAAHGEMPGMDMPEATPAPSGHDEMPGMDMPEATPSPSGHDEMPGMDMPEAGHQEGEAAGAPVYRPLAPVLGAFGGGTSAVLLTAGLMRRKDRATNLARKATRSAARSQK